MSNDYQNSNQQQYASESPKSSKNCCLWAAGGCGCFCVIAVVVIALLGWYGFRSMGGLMGGTVNAITIGTALEAYCEEHGHYPPAYSVDEDGNPLHSWRVLILPYIDASAANPFDESARETQDLKELYANIRLDEPWDSEHNKQFASKMPVCYLNATLKEEGKTNFQMVIGPKCISDGPGTRTADEIRQSPQAVVVVEANPSVEWMKPQDVQYTDIKANKFVDAGGATPGVTCPHSFATMPFGVTVIAGGEPEVYFNEAKFGAGQQQQANNALSIEQIRERALFETEIGENVPAEETPDFEQGNAAPEE